MDTEPPRGTLFLLLAAGERGRPSRRAASAALRARRAGLRVRAVPLRPADLQRGGVREALLAAGVSRLPALKPRDGPALLGCAAIAAWLAGAAREPRPARRSAPETEEGASEALEEYMQAAMRGDV